MLVTNFRVKYLLYRVVCAFYQLLDVGRIHPLRQRALRALEDTVNYIEEALPNAVGFDTQKEVTEFALRRVSKEGHLLEFGVYTGGTIRFIAGRVGGRIVHGFDSFQGLPEDWGGFSLDNTAFDVQGRLPKVPGNVSLYAGWIDKTLPLWVEQNAGPVAFLHIDVDLYSSTKTIFEVLADRLIPGTIILFDEYFNYPGWRKHEFLAFKEFVQARGIGYEYLAYARQQVVVRITNTSVT